jgi:hypothetical protein
LTRVQPDGFKISTEGFLEDSPLWWRPDEQEDTRTLAELIESVTSTIEIPKEDTAATAEASEHESPADGKYEMASAQLRAIRQMLILLAVVVILLVMVLILRVPG